MKNKVSKAYAISDAKIKFVSLVDKAANKKQFLITKSDNPGCANFQSFGKILKADAESHFVTGIVYEPMVEDSQGEYMTAEEITKAAHWFMKNDGDVDIQHCFEKANGVEVVESFVAKCDMEINGESIVEGTWIMTMEVTDSTIWDAIEKGDITGFSMGGTGTVSDEDVDLDTGDVEKSEKKTLFQKLAKAFGYEVIEKGKLTDTYNSRVKSDNFYTAWGSLRDTLEGYTYDEKTGTYSWGYSNDEEVIRQALTEFNEIVVGILAKDSVTKALSKAAEEKPVEKAGKSISSKNMETLTGICNSLSEFISSFASDEDDDDSECDDVDKGSCKNNKTKKEESDMKKSEVESLVQDVVAKAMQPIIEQVEAITKGDGETSNNGAEGGSEAGSGEPAPTDTDATPEDVSKAIDNAVAKAVDPIMKQLEAIRTSRALPSNLNGTPADVNKSDDSHYLHGFI